LHNALVVVGGQKMSKSLGNSVYATDLLDKAPAIIVRYALASAHYRSELDLHDGFLDEATAAFSRIEGFLLRARHEGLDIEGTVVPTAFASAMDEDLSVPAALAVVHETVRAGNNALDSGDRALAASSASEVRAMVRVLGIDPLDPEWARGSSRGDGALASLVESVIELRWHAKAEKNFELSDALRDVLDRAGIDVNDGASGSTWSIRG
jgi:cysteinyl-tRNA synthetase